MVRRVLAAVAAGFLVHVGPASAGDPVMRLSDVHAGMRCTGYSVVRGTEVSSFDVDVLDVVAGDPAESGPRILVQVSGPAVDATGIGPGFSGSPIYCRDAAGVSRNIGAISESVGEYGGRVALATPIESILATPVDPPAGRLPGGHPVAHALAAGARPLAGPLTVSGLTAPLARALSAAGRTAGRTVLAAPPGPLGSFPPQTLRPGSAVGIAYSSGDVRLGAVGTVAYTDGDRVWAFGHPLDGVGRRALLLEDAYVFRVIANPLQAGDAATYKLAALGHDLGALTSDGNDAVAGHTGPPPHTVPVRVFARDADTGRARTVAARVADEEGVDLPTGTSPLTGVAPLVVAQAASGLIGATPGRITGTLCANITLAERRKPLRFCNRYVSAGIAPSEDGSLGNAVTSGASRDVMDALTALESYAGRPPHATEVAVRLTLRRGQQQAFLERVRLPRRVRAGTSVRARVTLRAVRGGAYRRTYRLRIPAGLRAGRHTLRFAGRDADAPDAGLTTEILLGGDEPDSAGHEGPRTLAELASAVRAIGRYDGVSLRAGGERSHAFRDPATRISGRAEATTRVVRSRR